MHLPTPSYTFGKVAPDQHRQALARLMNCQTGPNEEQVTRMSQYIADSDPSVPPLWAAVDDKGQIIEAAMLIIRPGRTGVIFVSRPRRQGNLPILTQLIQTACAVLDQRTAVMVQALIAPDEQRENQALLNAGFQKLGRLNYMQRTIGARAPAPVVPDNAALQPYSHANRTAFEQVIDASYQQTLDCPGICGLRTMDDIMAGHMSVGQFDPARWQLLKIDDRPSGAILLSVVPEAQSVELVYLGLAPWARGRGWGRVMMQWAIHHCTAQRRHRLTLAVDQANTPAMKLYEQFDFYLTDHRDALILPITGQSNATRTPIDG